MIDAARKPETNKPDKTHHNPKAAAHPDGPVASGPNSVPNTTQRFTPAAFQDPPPPKGKSVRTCCRHVPPGTYLLIFHP